MRLSARMIGLPIKAKNIASISGIRTSLVAHNVYRTASVASTTCDVEARGRRRKDGIGSAGGSIPPEWHTDLSGSREADEPVPRAVADILRAHGATVVTTSAIVGSPDVRFELRFPAH